MNRLMWVILLTWINVITVYTACSKNPEAFEASMSKEDILGKWEFVIPISPTEITVLDYEFTPDNYFLKIYKNVNTNVNQTGKLVLSLEGSEMGIWELVTHNKDSGVILFHAQFTHDRLFSGITYSKKIEIHRPFIWLDNEGGIRLEDKK